jgi:hypothetical protein
MTADNVDDQIDNLVKRRFSVEYIFPKIPSKVQHPPTVMSFEN